MYKKLVSLVVNLNRITPTQTTMSSETVSNIKAKRKWRHKYRYGKYISPCKRNKLIMTALKANVHIADIVEKYNCSPDYVAYIMFLHRYSIYEITDITGVTKRRLLDAYLRY